MSLPPLSARAALVVAHPSHELRLHGWLEQTRPCVCVLTDGAGRSGEPRLTRTTEVLARAGATQGANGDVTLMVLPGNLPVSFSGHDIRHADGRQLQRLGIQPHVRVAPTIRGMIEGRDEILDAAVKYLQKKVLVHF